MTPSTNEELDNLYQPSMSDLELDEHQGNVRPVIYLDEAKAALQTLLEKERAEALASTLAKLQDKYDEAERRGKAMTSGNRAKWARDNESLAESHARNQGFKSGILVAQRVVSAELAAPYKEKQL